MTDPIKEFARWVIQESCFDGCDIDGGSVQDKAVELGLLVEELYDPVKHPNVEDVEEGDGVFVFTELMK
jgi:hypothetical protein